jgi:hypothetical protein
MFRIEVDAGGHTVECGFCGQMERISGPFVLGIQTPASVQEAMQWHHCAPPISRELFSSYRPCPAMDAWVSGAWVVVDGSGQLIAEGRYEMVEGNPVVDPSILGRVNGVDWDTRRVEQLAAVEIAASRNPERRWHMGPAGGNIRVNLRRNDGRYESAIVPLEEIHVTRINDEEIQRIIRTRLEALDAQGQ